MARQKKDKQKNFNPTEANTKPKTKKELQDMAQTVEDERKR